MVDVAWRAYIYIGYINITLAKKFKIMNLIIFFIVSIVCIIFLLLPFIKKNDDVVENLVKLSEFRKQRVLMELNSELENGTITNDQFNELKNELFQIESVEENKLENVNLDPVEEIIKLKKKVND